MKRTLPLLFTLVLTSASIWAQPVKDTLFVTEPVTPLIVNRPHNLYFNLRINPTTANQTLDELEFAIADNKYIESITVYYTGTQNMGGDVGFHKPSYSIKKCETTDISNNIKLAVNQKLFPANNYFCIGVTLNEKTPLTARIDVDITNALVNGQSIALNFRHKPEPRRVGVSVRNAGDDSVTAYRIPGLVTSKKGTLLAVYDVRRNKSTDLQEDIQVGLSRSFDKGQSWEKMQLAIDMRGTGLLPDAQNGVGDPAILVDQTNGDIYIMALWTHGMGGKMAWWGSSKNAMTPQQQAAQIVVVRSTDDGATWSTPMNITAQIKDPSWGILLQGPGMGITMADGTLVFAFQFVDKDSMPHATIISSKDKGKTWQIGSPARSNTTEAQVAEIKPGVLMLNMRDNRKGTRAIMTTQDMGKTWTEHNTSRSALIEPVCMASFIKVDDKTFLFSNPAHQKERTNMTIKSSTDVAQSWNAGLLIDDGGCWGYSCMTMVDDKNVGILYEGSQAHMTFQIIPLDEIISRL